ncbi:MAG: SGNH/GDSL hydrolase family protein [Magnetococcales bacterium]|nr:SGNH/GDSL hydrolase family protein [Magnetococcales bacterium]
MTSPKTPKKNRFERHPILTMMVVIIGVILLLLVVTETLLTLKHGPVTPYAHRAISLREFPPHYRKSKLPRDAQMALTDSLEKRVYTIRSDEKGFIMPSRIHDQPERTLLFLGGSTTECFYVDEEKRFPYLTGRLLEKRTGKKINALNAAFGGNHTLHSINILLNKGLPEKPDMAVMMHAINDLYILILEGSYWNDHRSRSHLVPLNKQKDSWLKRLIREKIPHINAGTRILQTRIKDTLDRWRGKENTPWKGAAADEWINARGRTYDIDNEGILSAFRRNLETFITTARIHGVTPVLMTQANRFKEDPDRLIAWLGATFFSSYGITYEQHMEIYRAFNDEIRAVARDHQVVLVDLDREIPHEREMMYDFVHLNDAGSEQAAAVIAATLEPHLSRKE